MQGQLRSRTRRVFESRLSFPALPSLPLSLIPNPYPPQRGSPCTCNNFCRRRVAAVIKVKLGTFIQRASPRWTAACATLAFVRSRSARRRRAQRGQGMETGEDAVQRQAEESFWKMPASRKEHFTSLHCQSWGKRGEGDGAPVEDHRAPSFHGSLPTRHVTARRLG